MRISIVPTGKLELCALGKALKNLFPNHDFISVSKVGDEPFDGFTSNPLHIGGPVPGKLLSIVEAAAAQAYPGIRHSGKSVDYVLIVDDLELSNIHQPNVVVDKVRLATKIHLDRLQRERPTLVSRVETALRERVSFHLICPMVESWLYADPGGLIRAEVPAARLPPLLLPNNDPEAFLANDPAYSADSGLACDARLKRAQRKGKKAKPEDWESPWMLHNKHGLVAHVRERHPKAYLCWLCREPNNERGTTYQEVEGGARSLEGLDWAAALRDPQQMTYLRSLVVDVADMLGISLPAAMVGQEASHTALSQRPRANVLRNL